MSKPKKKRKDPFDQAYYDNAAEAFKQLNPNIGNQQAVLLAGQQISKAYNVAVVQKILRQATGFSFSFKQLAPPKAKIGEAQVAATALGSVEEKSERKAEEAVQTAVTKAVVKESEEKITAVLEVGKGVVDTIGKYVADYGFPDVTSFLNAVLEFYLCYHDKVEALVDDLAEYRLAVEELTIKLGMFVRGEIREDKAQNRVVTLVLANAGAGKPSTPQEIVELLSAFRGGEK